MSTRPMSAERWLMEHDQWDGLRVYRINEEDLGSDATPEDAERMAELLTLAGYPTEYTDMSGPGSWSGEPSEDAPDSETWDRCLRALVGEAP